YYFEHSATDHRLKIIDRVASAGASQLALALHTELTHWDATYQLTAGAAHVRDFDETTLDQHIATVTTVHASWALPRWERQEYVGKGLAQGHITSRARTVIEGEEARLGTY